MTVDDVIADIEATEGNDPAVEAELGKPPVRVDGDGDGPFCPQCGIEPSLTGSRCWRCRGESMQETGA